MAIFDPAGSCSKARTVSATLIAACALPVFALDAATAEFDALDHIPPILQKVSVSGSVNAQQLNQYVTVSLRVTDDQSGVASFLIEVRSPSGMHHVSRLRTLPRPDDITAEATLGASPYSEPFTKFSEPGTWVLTKVVATDAAGNSVIYDEARLNDYGGQHTFQVTNSGGYDVTPPQLANGVIDTPNVRLSKQPPGLPDGTPPYVNGRVSITDSGNGAVSGSREGRLMFCLAGSGSCTPGNTNTFTMSNVTNRAGLVANTLTVGTQLSKSQIPGNYLIYSLELVDSAGSHQTLKSSDFGGSVNFHNYFPQGTGVFVNQ